MTQQSNSGIIKLTAKVKAAGCAAKISSSQLKEIVQSLSTLSCKDLLTGMENFEDAAVYKISDEIAIIESVDFFPPVVDDPYIYGQIAATNALSDIYAMGGRPILALNLLSFPTCDYPLGVATEILRGGASKVQECGAVLAGGHSIQGEPIFGMAVTGLIHPDKILTNRGAKGGDSIVLCKAIGTGVALLGLKGEVLSEEAAQELMTDLTTLNNTVLATALKYKLSAATDVTGFGLIGHLHEMAKASNLTACLFACAVPLLKESRQLAEQGFVPAGAYANRQSYKSDVFLAPEVDVALTDLFFDPQTSGGLLFALDEHSAKQLVTDLQQIGLTAVVIGKFKVGPGGKVEVSNHETEG